MSDSDLAELEKKKAALIASMIGYMNAANDPGYTEADTRKCGDILERFIDSLQRLGQETTDPEILDCVKNVVLELNTLNGSVGGDLIETMEREALYDYIIFAARRSGLRTDGDVTEKWREW